MAAKRYDYIIVGAGSAGCVLAARLSEDPAVSVCLLEYGGSDLSLWIRMPSALSYPMNMPRYNWGYRAEGDEGLDGRALDCPRGKVLGGSSSINGMVFVRGNAEDYNEWEREGACGWNHNSCLPYFRKLESWQYGADQWRGSFGPVPVNTGNDMRLNPLYQAFIDAGVQAGYPFTSDYNGHSQEGFGPMQMNVDRGIRASTARMYLKPARRRPNLTVLSGSMVDRVHFQDGRAVGVHYRSAKRDFLIEAAREVILSAGSIGSPSILQRSGVGDPELLRRHRIPVVAPLKGVGANLQDHLEVYFQYRCTAPVSLNRHLNLLGKARIGARWLATRTGLGATNHFEACGFIRSDDAKPWPNVQYHFLPAAMRYDGQSAFDGDGWQVHVGPNKPFSRGQVQIVSRDPRVAPSIRFNYLSAEQDVIDWRNTIRLTREILGQEALRAFRGEEIQPGQAVHSDEAIDAWVRANVESAYHPSCTVKMGADQDDMAVLDASLRVRGVEGLRVVDSSVFPTIPNGNLNAPTMMVAERGADLIKGI